MLTAGWTRPSASAARQTLRVLQISSNALSGRMSGVLMAPYCIQIANEVC